MVLVDLMSRTGNPRPVGPDRDTTLHGWNVLVCAPFGRERLMIPEWVAQRGGMPLIVSGCPEMLRVLCSSPGRPTMLVLVPGPECTGPEVVERCLSLRAVAPDAPMILVSPQGLCDDLLSDHTALCDVVLRTPITGWAFGAGARAAIRAAADRTQREAALADGRPGNPAGPAATAERSQADRAEETGVGGRLLYAGTRIAAGMILGWGSGLNGVTALVS